MPDNGKRRPYVSKEIRTLVKSWLCPFLLREQDKMARQENLLVYSEVMIKGLVEEKKHNHKTSLIYSVTF